MVNSLKDSSESQGIAPKVDEVCSICFGTGTRLEPGKGAAICDCRRTNTGARALDAARIPSRFRNCSLKSYKYQNESQAVALNLAHYLVEHYPGVDKGLLMMGGIGVGKTHLAIAILRDLIEKKGVSCLFFESGALLKAIQESYSPISQTSEMRVLAPVFEAEVLVLDELGSTISTDWVRDTLYQIINTRYNNNKLTIFTTNYADEIHIEDDERRLQASIRELEFGEYNPEKVGQEKRLRERLKQLRESQRLEDRIGPRLRSRLYEMCKKVVINGEDFRRRNDQPRS